MSTSEYEEATGPQGLTGGDAALTTQHGDEVGRERKIATVPSRPAAMIKVMHPSEITDLVEGDVPPLPTLGYRGALTTLGLAITGGLGAYAVTTAGPMLVPSGAAFLVAGTTALASGIVVWWRLSSGFDGMRKAFLDSANARLDAVRLGVGAYIIRLSDAQAKAMEVKDGEHRVALTAKDDENRLAMANAAEDKRKALAAKDEEYARKGGREARGAVEVSLFHRPELQPVTFTYHDELEKRVVVVFGSDTLTKLGAFIILRSKQNQAVFYAFRAVDGDYLLNGTLRLKVDSRGKKFYLWVQNFKKRFEGDGFEVAFGQRVDIQGTEFEFWGHSDLLKALRQYFAMLDYTLDDGMLVSQTIVTDVPAAAITSAIRGQQDVKKDPLAPQPS